MAKFTVGFFRTHRVLTTLIAGFVLLLSAIVMVASAKRISPVSWGWYGEVQGQSGVAIGGYDPVAYHRAGVAKAGQETFATDWHGARWLFDTDENRAMFENNPEQYAPEFGGFCAFAASKGFTAKTDPTAWRIEQGRLYLFNDASMRENWDTELGEGVIAKGKQAWEQRPAAATTP